jgi:hypothetical protein
VVFCDVQLVEESSQRPYYYSHVSKASQWDPPRWIDMVSSAKALRKDLQEDQHQKEEDGRHDHDHRDHHDDDNDHDFRADTPLLLPQLDADTREVYYFNLVTGESRWDRPSDFEPRVSRSPRARRNRNRHTDDTDTATGSVDDESSRSVEEVALLVQERGGALPPKVRMLPPSPERPAAAMPDAAGQVRTGGMMMMTMMII